MREPPRYLRFVAALVLGTAAVAVSPMLTGCEDDERPPIDAALPPIDAEIPDADENIVDGPLHPPDLPRAAA